MDTRAKIVDLEKALQVATTLRERGASLRLVTGYFDVLTADHVRRLRDLAAGHALIAVVLDPPSPLLSPRARAELAAGLAMIECVVPVNGARLDDVLLRLGPAEVIREEPSDERRRAQLMQHVRSRQTE